MFLASASIDPQIRIITIISNANTQNYFTITCIFSRKATSSSHPVYCGKVYDKKKEYEISNNAL